MSKSLICGSIIYDQGIIEKENCVNSVIIYSLPNLYDLTFNLKPFFI